MQWFAGLVAATVLSVAFSIMRSTAALRPYSATAAAQGSTTLYLSDTGFRVHEPTRSLQSDWKSLRRIAENREFFLLFVSDIQAVVVPKRAVPTDAAEWLRAMRDERAQRVAREFALWGRRFPWG